LPLEEKSEQSERSSHDLLNQESLPQGRPLLPARNLYQGQSTVRSLVRLLIFWAIAFELGPVLINEVAHTIFGALPTDSIAILMFLEAGNFALVLGVSAGMAVLERRRIGEYGLPAKEMFRKNFWLGGLLGLAEVTVLVGLIAAFGGYSFGSLALHGGDILRWGLVHSILFVFVGLYEEYLFRGYAQFTLGEGIGFWPAAVLLSIGFGYMHLTNRGENWIGAASVGLVGLLFVFTLKRSGNLWYAVGLHTSFDWGETFLYSVPNSGEVLPGHLSNAVLHGPAWLTGGAAGPEGSMFCFLTMGLQFLVVLWLFPKRDMAEIKPQT
jgi:membrane protease YdiL (CAAX protease family)